MEVDLVGVFVYIMIIVSIFAGIGGPLLFWYISYVSRRRKLQTLERMLEQGAEPSLALLKELGPGSPKEHDFRVGVICISFGLGLMVFFSLVTRIQAASIGLIPFFIGIGYLVIMRYGYIEDEHKEFGKDKL